MKLRSYRAEQLNACPRTTSGEHIMEQIAYKEYTLALLPPVYITCCKACGLLDDGDPEFQKALKKHNELAFQVATAHITKGKKTNE